MMRVDREEISQTSSDKQQTEPLLAPLQSSAKSLGTVENLLDNTGCYRDTRPLASDAAPNEYHSCWQEGHHISRSIPACVDQYPHPPDPGFSVSDVPALLYVRRLGSTTCNTLLHAVHWP